MNSMFSFVRIMTPTYVALLRESVRSAQLTLEKHHQQAQAKTLNGIMNIMATMTVSDQKLFLCMVKHKVKFAGSGTKLQSKAANADGDGHNAIQFSFGESLSLNEIKKLIEIERVQFVVNETLLRGSLTGFKDHRLVKERTQQGQTVYSVDYPVQVCKDLLEKHATTNEYKQRT